MTERRREPTPIGEILQDYLQRQEREKQGPRQRAAGAWAAVTADGSAPGTRVVRYLKGVVTIEVKSPPLCAELAQFRRSELLARLREEAGEELTVKDLRFRLGAW